MEFHLPEGLLGGNNWGAFVPSVFCNRDFSPVLPILLSQCSGAFSCPHSHSWQPFTTICLQFCLLRQLHKHKITEGACFPFVSAALLFSALSLGFIHNEACLASLCRSSACGVLSHSLCHIWHLLSLFISI